MEKSNEQLTPTEVQQLLENEKELVLQEQIELSTIMSKPPILKELWKYGAIQFGYISFFLLSFPAAALIGVILNVIHINFLYYSFTHHTQRRNSVERSDIGVWNSIFFIMSFIALCINMGILVFSSIGFRVLLGKILHHDYDAYTVIVILIVIEHIGFILKFLVGSVMQGMPQWVLKILSEQSARKHKDNEKMRKKYAMGKNKNKRQDTEIAAFGRLLNQTSKDNIKANCDKNECIDPIKYEVDKPKRKDSMESEDSRFDSILEKKPILNEPKKSEFSKNISVKKNDWKVVE